MVPRTLPRSGPDSPSFLTSAGRRYAPGGAACMRIRAGRCGRLLNDMNEPAIFNVRERPCRSTPCIASRSRALRRGTPPCGNAQCLRHAQFPGDLRGPGAAALRYSALRLDARHLCGWPALCRHLTGDNTSSWNHLRLSIPMLSNLGFPGSVTPATTSADSRARVRHRSCSPGGSK